MFFNPLYSCAHVTDIPLNHLKELGISLILLDLDNTLKKPHTNTVCPTILNWLATCKEQGLTCICVSNNKQMQYCLDSEEQLGIPVIYRAHKPFGNGIAKALKETGMSPKQSVLVGDRPLTDIWGAAHYNMHSILVNPLRQGEEPLHYVILRWLERRVIGRVKYPLAISVHCHD